MYILKKSTENINPIKQELAEMSETPLGQTYPGILFHNYKNNDVHFDKSFQLIVSLTQKVLLIKNLFRPFTLFGYHPFVNLLTSLTV